MKYINTGVFYGFLGGCLYFIWFLVIVYFEANPFYSFPQKLVIVWQLPVTFLGIYNFRRWQNQGRLSFAEGVWVGAWITIISALTYAIAVYVYTHYFQPQLVVAHQADLRNYLLANKERLIAQSNATIFGENLKNVDTVTAYTLVLDHSIWNVLKGLMFSILSSIPLRNAGTASNSNDAS